MHLPLPLDTKPVIQKVTTLNETVISIDISHPLPFEYFMLEMVNELNQITQIPFKNPKIKFYAKTSQLFITSSTVDFNTHSYKFKIIGTSFLNSYKFPIELESEYFYECAAYISPINLQLKNFRSFQSFEPDHQEIRNLKIFHDFTNQVLNYERADEKICKKIGYNIAKVNDLELTKFISLLRKSNCFGRVLINDGLSRVVVDRRKTSQQNFVAFGAILKNNNGILTEKLDRKLLETRTTHAVLPKSPDLSKTIICESGPRCTNYNNCKCCGNLLPKSNYCQRQDYCYNNQTVTEKYSWKCDAGNHDLVCNMTSPLNFNRNTYLLTWKKEQFNLKDPEFRVVLKSTQADLQDPPVFVSKPLTKTKFHIWTPILDGIDVPSGEYFIDLEIKDKTYTQWSSFSHRRIQVNLDTSDANRPRHPCEIPELHYMKGQVYPEIILCTQLNFTRHIDKNSYKNLNLFVKNVAANQNFTNKNVKLVHFVNTKHQIPHYRIEHEYFNKKPHYYRVEGLNIDPILTKSLQISFSYLNVHYVSKIKDIYESEWVTAQ